MFAVRKHIIFTNLFQSEGSAAIKIVIFFSGGIFLVAWVGIYFQKKLLEDWFTLSGVTSVFIL